MAILVNRSIKYRQLDNVFDCSGKLEVCAIEVFVQGDPLILCSCYRPQSAVITSQEWLSFFTQFGSQKVFFGGDFNAHNPAWGSACACSAGTNMWKALLDSELSLLNDGSSTFHSESYHTQFAIDLSIVHSSLALRLGWEVGEDPWGSDHFPIFVHSCLHLDALSSLRTSPRLYSVKTDWTVFQKHMDGIIKRNLPPSLGIEVRYPSFVALLGDALREATPHAFHHTQSRKNNSTISRPPCPW